MDKKPQMMICTRAKKCKSSTCYHKKPHNKEVGCVWFTLQICAAYPCIPYVEPSPKDTVCNYPASCGGKRTPDACDKEKCDAYEPQPEPSMPLIKLPLRCSRGKACEYLCLDHCSICQFIKVDTTAHDQQVRKGLIEEVCKLLDDELRIISPNTEAKLKAHLRAMAEK